MAVQPSIWTFRGWIPSHMEIFFSGPPAAGPYGLFFSPRSPYGDFSGTPPPRGDVPQRNRRLLDKSVDLTNSAIFVGFRSGMTRKGVGGYNVM